MPCSSPRRAVQLVLSLALAVAGAVSVAAPPAAAVGAALPVPQPAVALPAEVEGLPRYQGSTSCDPTSKPGVVRFATLVQATYAGTGSSGIVRDCNDATSLSEHTEGRAWDWRVSKTNAGQVAQVRAFHDWLLAPSSTGQVAANARRLGVMYIIWDRQILHVSRPDAGWQPYSCSGVTGCHEDHVHYSFTWAGAHAQTSFWSGKVAATDHGPCRPNGRMFSAPYSAFNGSPCPAWQPLPAGVALVERIRAVQDQRLELGSTGTAVSVLQAALGGQPATGTFDRSTRGRVHLFQARRGLARTGIVDRATWASLVSYLTSGAAVLAPPAPAPPPAPTSPAPVAAPNPRAVPQPAPTATARSVAPPRAARPVTVTARFARSTVRVRTTSTLTVTTSAASRGRTVVRQQLVAGRWASLERGVLDARGSRRFVVRPLSRGVKTYRVVLLGAPSRPAATSAAARLTAR